MAWSLGRYLSSLQPQPFWGMGRSLILQQSVASGSLSISPERSHRCALGALLNLYDQGEEGKLRSGWTLCSPSSWMKTVSALRRREVCFPRPVMGVTICQLASCTSRRTGSDVFSLAGEQPCSRGSKSLMGLDDQGTH